jgi:hypothetical protein
MAILDISFSNEELQDFSPLPEGEYFFKIEKVELKDTLANDGNKYLEVQCVVTEGMHSKRKFFGKLHIVNKNETAQSIGRRALTQLRAIAGIPENGLTNTDQLIGVVGVAKLGMEISTEGRAPKNKVLFYKQASASTPSFIEISIEAEKTFAAPPAKSAFPPVPTYAEATLQTKGGKVAPWMGG